MHPKSPRALVFASPPPPMGGVASIVQMLQAQLGARADLLFVMPLAKGSACLAGWLRPLRNLARLWSSTLRVARGGRVLVFSSAGPSFYEKVLWAACVQALGRQPVLAMVDGNFPAFWQRQSGWLQALVRHQLVSGSVLLGAQSETWVRYYRDIFGGAAVQEFSATVAPDFWQPRRVGSPDPARVLYVGWMIPGKGIHDLLDAFVAVAGVQPQARLRLVGPLFGQEARWAGEIARRRLIDQVDLVGPIVDRAALLQEMQHATVLVLPSHAEGLPVALLEAMAQGVACVATAVGAVPDVLGQGEAGILVPPHAPDALANAITGLLADAPVRERLAAAARARAQAHYGPQAFVDSYLALLGLP